MVYLPQSSPTPPIDWGVYHIWIPIFILTVTLAVIIIQRIPKRR